MFFVVVIFSCRFEVKVVDFSIVQLHHLGEYLLMGIALNVDGFAAAKGHAGAASLTQTGIHSGDGFDHYAVPVLYLLPFDGLIGTGTLTQKASHAGGIQRRRASVHHGDQRITSQLIR